MRLYLIVALALMLLPQTTPNAFSQSPASRAADKISQKLKKSEPPKAKIAQEISTAQLKSKQTISQAKDTMSTQLNWRNQTNVTGASKKVSTAPLTPPQPNKITENLISKAKTSSSHTPLAPSAPAKSQAVVADLKRVSTPNLSKPQKAEVGGAIHKAEQNAATVKTQQLQIDTNKKKTLQDTADNKKVVNRNNQNQRAYEKKEYENKEFVQRKTNETKVAEGKRPKRTYMQPTPDAAGPHSVWKKDNKSKTTNYATYSSNPKNPTGFDEVKRVDLVGKPHHNKLTEKSVQTPHVQGKQVPGGVRPATVDEIPKKYKK